MPRRTVIFVDMLFPSCLNHTGNPKGTVKARWLIGSAALLVFAGWLLWHKWSQDEPRRNSITALQNLRAALESSTSDSLLSAVVLPQAFQTRTAPERAEFLRKALQNEVSEEGIAVLRKHGTFGRLKELFPDEADAWANQAGVKTEDCVAFKLDQNGLRTEVVLVAASPSPPSEKEAGERRPVVRNSPNSTAAPAKSRPTLEYRVLRCNNVKRMAGNL